MGRYMTKMERCLFIQGEFRNGRPEGYGMIFDEGGRILYLGWIDIEKMGLA